MVIRSHLWYLVVIRRFNKNNWFLGFYFIQILFWPFVTRFKKKDFGQLSFVIIFNAFTNEQEWPRISTNDYEWKCHSWSFVKNYTNDHEWRIAMNVHERPRRPRMKKFIHALWMARIEEWCKSGNNQFFYDNYCFFTISKVPEDPAHIPRDYRSSKFYKQIWSGN